MSDFITRFYAGEFDHTVLYPKKDSFKDKCPNCGSSQCNNDKYAVAMVNWKQAEARKNERIKQAIFQDLGIENNPVKDIMFERAWSEGHSNGWVEVYRCLADLIGYTNSVIAAYLNSK